MPMARPGCFRPAEPEAATAKRDDKALIRKDQADVAIECRGKLMRNIAITYLTVLIVFTAVDFVWLGLIALDFYKKEIGSLMLATPRLEIAALFYVICAAGIWTFLRLGRNQDHKDGWIVDRLAGAPLVGSKRMEGGGTLGVGQWIETDRTSRATLHPGNIGEVDVEPQSCGF